MKLIDFPYEIGAYLLHDCWCEAQTHFFLFKENNNVHITRFLWSVVLLRVVEKGILKSRKSIAWVRA